MRTRGPQWNGSRTCAILLEERFPCWGKTSIRRGGICPSLPGPSRLHGMVRETAGNKLLCSDSQAGPDLFHAACLLSLCNVALLLLIGIMCQRRRKAAEEEQGGSKDAEEIDLLKSASSFASSSASSLSQSVSSSAKKTSRAHEIPLESFQVSSHG
eukprot:760326-Hanusia_phi.AAC.1